MEDNIVEIIPQSALAALDEANKLLSEAVNNVNSLAEAGKRVKLDIGNVGGLSSLSQVASQVNTITDQMVEANEKVAQSVRKRQRAIDMAERDELLAVQRKIEEEKRLIIEKDKIEDEAARNSARRAESTVKYMERLVKEREKAQKAAERAALLAAKEANAYEKLKKEYTATANEAKRLSAQYGVGSAEAKKFNDEAAIMAQRLKEIEAAVGQHQRSVGNYQNATLALSQIIREAPAFANSLQTGLMAISNNLPSMVDEFKKLKEATGDTKEALKILTGSLFSFGNIMILAFTALQFALPLLQEYFQTTDKSAEATKKYNDSLVQVNQTLAENIAKQTIENKQLLMTAANTELAMKTRVDAIDKLRKANEGVLDDMNDEIFLLGKTTEAYERLTKATYARFVAEAYGEKAALAMKKKVELTTERIAAEDDKKKGYKKGEVIPSVLDEAKIELKKAQDLLFDAQEEFANRSDFNNRRQLQNDIEYAESNLKIKKKNLQDVEDAIQKSNIQVEKFMKDRDDALIELEKTKAKPENNLQALEAELQVEKNKLETMRLAKGITDETKAAQVSALQAADKEWGATYGKQQARVKQLSELIDKLRGKEDKKQPRSRDYELQYNNERIKAIYEARKQEMEAARDFNKEIADDEKASLDARLVAYQKYVAAILTLEQLDRDEQLALEDEKIAALNRKAKSAKGEELKAIKENIEAANIRKLTIQNAFQTKTEAVERNAVKDTIQITISANNEWVKNEEEANEKVLQERMALYMAEETLLQNALKNREITRKEYNKRLADVQKQANLMALEAAIAFDEKILANQELSDEKRLQYEKKLTADKKAYMNAQKGIGGSTRNTSRITDPIALMFAPEENQEQYLQDFYNRTVEMARAATDAIIQAKNRQYEEERKRLDEQAEAIQKNYELQAAAINATERNEVERSNKLNQLLVTTQTKQAEIENQKKKAAQEQAKFQRAASMAAIIQNTAVAIASALKYGPAAPPIIALIAATGAIQLASAANAPIPAYATGTTDHTGGLFWAGDGNEREMIVPGNGKSPYWSKPTATLYNEPKGTMVLPESWLKFATSNMDWVNGSTAQGMTIINVNEQKIIDGLGERVERSLIKHGNYLGSQIAGSKTDLSEITEAIRRQQKLQ